jgi:adenine-specific DNA-methyltransferase
MAGETEARFIDLMSELFQLREADALDFGIYRLIRRYNRRIREFLGLDENGEPLANGGEIGKILEQAFRSGEAATGEEQKHKLEKLGKDLGIEPSHEQSKADEILAECDKIPALHRQVADYRDLRDQLLAARGADDDRAEVLNRLIEFYSRHYQDGDFIVERRYGKNGARYIKSTGEDTEFRWATEDMYYIKSGDIFTDFSVRLSNGKTVIFSVDPDTLAKTRAELKPSDKAGYQFKRIQTEDGKTRVILDYIKGAQNKGKLTGIVTEAASRTGGNAEEIERHLRRFIERHLRRFIARNQSDFFIHKRLREALDEDLDIFIKTCVLDVGQLLAADAGTIPDRAIRQARAVRKIGGGINAFLGVLEDHQKRLWEKKKLVFETRYVITLDRLERYCPDWLAQNIGHIVEKQRQEWQALGLGDYADADAAACRRSLPELPTQASQTELALPSPSGKVARKEGNYLPLPVDTGNFNGDFQWSLLAAVTAKAPLDEALHGVAIHSDNWQALNLMQDKYRERVKCIYIDPPYNTGGDGFPYKDAFKHSSWMAMIGNRLELARNLMPTSSALYASIDENERDSLTQALNAVFGEHNRAEEIIWGQNTTKNQSPTFSTNHEYIPVYARSLAACRTFPAGTDGGFCVTHT